MAASFPIAGRTPMLGPLPSKPTELPPEVARAFVRDIIGAWIASRTGAAPPPGRFAQRASIRNDTTPPRRRPRTVADVPTQRPTTH